MVRKEDEECNGKHITHLFIYLCIDFILVSHSHYIQFKFKVLIFKMGYYQHIKVQMRYKQKNMTTGLDQPYDIEFDFTSRFPIGFRGCFVCGATDHFGTSK